MTSSDEASKNTIPINLLAPNSMLGSPFASLLVDELPKIGFDVIFENVGWDIIAPRTFNWKPESVSAPNIIPTAENGGYDLLFVGLSGSISYDPTYSYSGTHFSATGDNFAHYNNTKVTELCEKYVAELDQDTRIGYATEIQGIIADEIPYIPFVNTYGLWAYDGKLRNNYTEADWLLLSTSDVGDGWKSHKATSDTLVYAHTYELQEFTSFVISSYITAQYLAPVQIGLFERDPSDPNYDRKPLIATEMPVWDATKTIANVSLRHDVTFSNGHKLNSTDVVNTYRMALTVKFS